MDKRTAIVAAHWASSISLLVLSVLWLTQPIALGWEVAGMTITLMVATLITVWLNWHQSWGMTPRPPETPARRRG